MSSLFTVAFWLLSSVSSAQAPASPDEVRARVLFEEGARYSQARDYDRAVATYTASYALHPHPGTLMNLALCQDAAGRLAEARASWTALLIRFGAVISPQARQRAESRLAELTAGDQRVDPSPPSRRIDVFSPAPVADTEPDDDGFWSSAWPWVLGAVMVATASALTLFLFWPEDDEPIASWSVGLP